MIRFPRTPSPRLIRNAALAILGFAIPLASYAAISISNNAWAAGPHEKSTMNDTATKFSASGFNITPLSEETVQTLAKDLTDEERKVILNEGTEAPFCGNLLDNKKDGVYHCRLCKLPLFGSDSKFKSGTGWPSFFTPVDPDHVDSEVDNSLGMRREEITCARCGGHLGHVFPDGPPDSASA